MREGEGGRRCDGGQGRPSEAAWLREAGGLEGNRRYALRHVCVLQIVGRVV